MFLQQPYNKREEDYGKEEWIKTKREVGLIMLGGGGSGAKFPFPDFSLSQVTFSQWQGEKLADINRKMK